MTCDRWTFPSVTLLAYIWISPPWCPGWRGPAGSGVLWRTRPDLLPPDWRSAPTDPAGPARPERPGWRPARKKGVSFLSGARISHSHLLGNITVGRRAPSKCILESSFLGLRNPFERFIICDGEMFRFLPPHGEGLKYLFCYVTIKWFRPSEMIDNI